MRRGRESFPIGAAGLVDVNVRVHDARASQIVAGFVDWAAGGDFVERRDGGDYSVLNMNRCGSGLARRLRRGRDCLGR